jgi:histidyl-tRNA synthetase
MDKPSLPKGTRDFGPAQMAKRQFIFEIIKKVFQKYGFQPLETPAMENLSTLTGKYGEEGDQLLFRILNSGDFLRNSDLKDLESRDSKQLASNISEKGLRYDLTVPFARYVVMNRHEITFPFRRYQIQPVWRADRPQKGRYREFYQCDADVVGTDSLICEAEIILMVNEIFEGLGIKDYTIKINHRDVLSALAEITGSRGQESPLFVAMDKLEKVGEEKVKEELISRGFDKENITKLFDILGFKGSASQKLEFLSTHLALSKTGPKGISDLKEVLRLLQDCGKAGHHTELDTSLARGLSYYTGIIFEVKIHGVSIGSVSGGGRYDNLTGVFGMPGISGTGISFGVDRMYDAMEELTLFSKEAQISSKVLISHTDESSLQFGLSLLQQIRAKGIASEIYPDVAKLKKQLDYANKKMIPFVIIIGSDEMESGLLTFKHMEKGEEQKLPLDKILGFDFQGG